MTPNVLIVDDERGVRWSLRRRMEEEGYAAVEAETAAEAMARFQDGADLVLLDDPLPDEDGLALLKRFKALKPDVPVLVVTADSTVEKAVAAMQEGAYHYIRKPHDLDAIAGLVGQALDRTRLDCERRRQRRSGSSVTGFKLPPTGVDFRNLERELVLQALEHAGGNQTRAAALLGMNRDQIRYRIAKFELDTKPEPEKGSR